MHQLYLDPTLLREFEQANAFLGMVDAATVSIITSEDLALSNSLSTANSGHLHVIG